jgi:hypothetical protein
MAGLNRDIRWVFKGVFEYLLSNLRFGRLVDGDRAENHQLYYYTATTDSAGGEFTIQHKLGVAPYMLLPVLNLQAEGDKLVPLEVSQVADAKRIYLKSTVNDAEITIAVEG